MKPKIRIKGFTGEWKETTYGESVTINSGMDYKHLSIGDIPVYGTGGYMLSVNESLSDTDAIGIGRKGTIDKPQLLKAPFWTVDTLFFMTPQKGINLNFLFALSQKTNWRKYDESTGVPSLSKVNIAKIDIKIPKEEEQKAIAFFFSSLDSLIQSTTKKIESLKQVKAASLQSMFPQEGETTPRVRFKGFEGEWEKVTLGDCLTINSERNQNNVYGINDVLSVSDEVGVVNQIKLLGRSYAGKSVANYRVLKTNQIVYTKSPLKSKPYGIVKVNKGSVGIVSVLYAVYDAKDDVCPDYIHYYFEPTYRINNYLLPLINKGAKNTMNISDEMALRGYIWIPSFDEQKKIADYLQVLDSQITLHSQRLEKLKQIKSACLDNMFV